MCAAARVYGSRRAPQASPHMPTSRGGRAWRYSLTTRGTKLLARAVGLIPTTYRRIYGVLDDAQCPGERGLSFARANLEHTDGITQAFMSFLRAARLRGGQLSWCGEWACARTHFVTDCSGQSRRHILRPDAELHYSGAGGPLHAFVEIDRAQESARRLAGKINQYGDYRQNLERGTFAVLLVVPGTGRGAGPLARAQEIAMSGRVPFIDLRVATASDLATHGPWAPIWRSMHGTMNPLEPGRPSTP